MSDAYKQGFLDGIAAYAWNKDGCLWVGTTGTTLKQAQQNVEKTWNYSPVPAGSPPENYRFKYELGKVVHYLHANTFCSAPVLSRQYVQNAHDAWAHTKEQKATFTPWGESGIYYSTCHGQFPEDHLYPSKEAMVIPAPFATNSPEGPQ